MEEEPQQYLILSDSVTQKKAQIKWNIRTHNDFEYPERNGQSMQTAFRTATLNYSRKGRSIHIH